MASGHYALGPAALRLGAIIAADAGVLAAARPVAAELMLRTGETVMLATLDERSAEALYLDVIYSQQDIRYSPRVGSRWPLYCTGMGRALLAFQEPSFIHRYLAETDMLRRTPRTVTERTRLRRIIDEVRGSGVVVTQGEHTIGAGAEVSWTLGGHAAPPSKFAPQDSGNSTSSLAAAPLKRTSKARQGERRPA